nr:MAG TPA: hypothetical protein [Caudoviricetes sp.]
MRTNLMMAAIAAVGMTIVSCGSDNENLVEDVKPGKAHVKVVCGMGVSVSPMGAPMRMPMSRAALSANGKALTDIYILDYDKVTGKLLQVLHQTSAATNFAEPDLTLDYGEHVLKVVATRSQEPTLWDAGNITWQVESNVLTPVTATQPVVLTASKTSDTFGAEKEVSVGIGKATTVSIALDRLVAKLVVNSTDVFPDDCTTITLDMQEYKSLSWATMDVMEAVGNQRTVDVQGYRGTTGTTFAFYFLTPKAGYQTDITLRTNRTEGKPYSAITMENVPLERNKVTTITGPLYKHGQSFQMTVNDEWNSEGNDINI